MGYGIALDGRKKQLPVRGVKPEWVPDLWRRNLELSGTSEHPAQLVWVDPLTAEDALEFWCDRDQGADRACLDDHPEDALWAAMSPPKFRTESGEGQTKVYVPQASYRVPPIPAAWCVLGTAIAVCPPHTAGQKHDVTLLRSFEWQHRDDGSVLVVGNTAVQNWYGNLRLGACVPTVVTAEGVMLPLDDAEAIGSGTLITGREAPAPLFSTPELVPTRLLQRAVVYVAQILWDRWYRGLAGGYDGELIEGEFPPREPSNRTQVRVDTHSVPGVHVVRAYRPRSGHGNAGDIGEHARTEPGYRWKVRGHWRLQPCGPRGTQRRKIWVEEHVSGPPDKPVRDTPTVIAL
jgi:hypothetical protein